MDERDGDESGSAYKDICAMAGETPITLPYGEMIGTIAPESRPEGVSDAVWTIIDNVYEALCDDLNTPIALAHLFDAVKMIHSAKDGYDKLSDADAKALARLFSDTVVGVMGLQDEAAGNGGANSKAIDGLMEMVLEERAAAKAAKDWAKSDTIRDKLKAIGITVKDTKNGAEWTIE